MLNLEAYLCRRFQDLSVLWTFQHLRWSKEQTIENEKACTQILLFGKCSLVCHIGRPDHLSSASQNHPHSQSNCFILWPILSEYTIKEKRVSHIKKYSSMLTIVKAWTSHQSSATLHSFIISAIRPQPCFIYGRSHFF